MDSSMFNTIVITSPPKGNFISLILAGAYKPGIILDISPAVEPVGGKYTGRIATPGGDGQRNIGPYMILTESNISGRTITTAYEAGETAIAYCPVPGDELLVMKTNEAGTDVIAIGDKFILDNSSGSLLATTGTPESEPFISLQTVNAVWTADTLLHVMYTGQ